jgi:hypothetical protein
MLALTALMILVGQKAPFPTVDTLGDGLAYFQHHAGKLFHGFGEFFPIQHQASGFRNRFQ